MEAEGLNTQPAEQALAESVIVVGVQKRQQLDQLIAMAMSGLLPRARELKYWEPAQLDERHLQAVMMRAAGLQQGYIAKTMGWTDAWTSIVLNHPDAQYLLTKIVSYAGDNVLDIQSRIRAHAGEALDKVVEVMRTTQDHRLASSNAFELLKMAGYGAVEKKQVEHSVAIPMEKAGLLTAALEESNKIRALEGIDYRVVAPENTYSDVPVVPENSGSRGAVMPPDGDSQEVTPIREVA
jgi:transcriptional regulator